MAILSPPPAPTKKDLEEFYSCKFRGIEFFIPLDRNGAGAPVEQYSIWYDEAPTVTTYQDANSAVNAQQQRQLKIQNKIKYLVGDDTPSFTIKGFVVGTDNYKLLKDALIDHNAKYVNQSYDPKYASQIKSGKAALQLPLTLIKSVMVINHKWQEPNLAHTGEYHFTATFAATVDNVTFTIQDKNLKAGVSVKGNELSFIEKAINAIRNFNLSYYLNQGLGAYANFMQSTHIDDVLALMSSVQNTAQSLEGMAKQLIGPNGSTVRNILSNILSNAKSFVETPVTMFQNIGSLFGNITSTTGNSVANKSAFNNIITTPPTPYTPIPNNAVKIINAHFMYNLFSSFAYNSYCNEVIKTTYLTKDEINNEISNLQNMYVSISPVLFIQELTTIKSDTIEFLQQSPANNYIVQNFSVYNIGWIPLLYTWFKRVNSDDEQLVLSLNPEIDINNINGTIRLPVLIS